MQVITAYRGNGCIDPPVLNPATIYKSVVSLTALPIYPRRYGPQYQSKRSCLDPKARPDGMSRTFFFGANRFFRRPARYPVTVPTAPSRLPKDNSQHTKTRHNRSRTTYYSGHARVGCFSFLSVPGCDVSHKARSLLTTQK